MHWFRTKLPLLVALLVTMSVAQEAMCWHGHSEVSQDVLSVQDQDHGQLPTDTDGCCHCLACHHHPCVGVASAETTTVFPPAAVEYFSHESAASDGVACSIEYPPRPIA